MTPHNGPWWFRTRPRAPNLSQAALRAEAARGNRKLEIEDLETLLGLDRHTVDTMRREWNDVRK